jgi:hypothetical protein
MSGGQGTITVVNGATIRANEVFVGDGGTLRGNSTINGNVFLQGSPFNLGEGEIDAGTEIEGSIGHLTIMGDLSIAGGTLVFDIAGTSADISYDQISVGGMAQFANYLSLKTSGGFNFSAGQSFVLVDAAEWNPMSEPPSMLPQTVLVDGLAPTFSYAIGNVSGDLVFEALNSGSGAATLEFGAAFDDGAIGTLTDGSGMITGGRFNGGVNVVGTTALRGTAAADNITAFGLSSISLEGLDGGDSLTGGDGVDTLYGGGDNDALSGGIGDDFLDGGAGGDTMSGGADTDTAYYYSSTAGVTVNLASGIGTGGDAQGDTYDAIEQVIGSNMGADGLTGNGVINYLNGVGGDDIIDGGGVTAPSLVTYQGDSLDGGAGTDTLSYATSLFGVVVLMDWNSPTSGIAWNGTSGDLMINFENLTGSAQNDVLLGNSVANIINGGGGPDSIYGLGGADTFHFDLLQTDVIADFEDGTDHLRFNLATADNFSDFTIYGNGTHLMSVVLTADGSQVVVQGTGSTNVTLTADDFVFV